MGQPEVDPALEVRPLPPVVPVSIRNSISSIINGVDPELSKKSTAVVIVPTITRDGATGELDIKLRSALMFNQPDGWSYGGFLDVDVTKHDLSAGIQVVFSR